MNGGLSDARNYGTGYVKTEYVTYIDSDDYVEPQYVELLLKGLDAGADMVVTHHVQEYEDVPRQAKITNDFIELTSEEALKWMCYEKLSTSAGGKLFPKKYVEDDPFPVGKLYEDLWTIYKYIGRSKKVAFNKSQTYHYLQRKGSIRQGRWDRRYFDVMEGAENLLKYIDKRYPELHEAGIFRYYYSANELYVRAFETSNYKNIIKPVQKTLKCHIREILNNKDVSNKYKIQYLLMTEFPNIYKKVWIYKKRRR
jgi:glycosyltransferase involved in cell wall biosynthesis